MKTTTIGARIKARRQELKMTQRDLAARMGYTDHTTITRIESGKTDPPQSRVAQFAKVLDVTPGHLMGWDKEPEDLADVAAQVLAACSGLLDFGTGTVLNADGGFHLRRL